MNATDLQPTISRMAQKLQQLLRHLDQLRKENERLRTAATNKQQELEAEQDKVRVLEEKVSILQSSAGGGGMDEKAKKDFEKKINQYIKDIDKVLVHLNG